MLILGHRGASGYAPENTIGAFQMAVGMHADGIECDVHITKDNHLVICHDRSIDRTSSGTGVIKDMTLAEIKQQDFTCKFYGMTPRCTAPTMEEMLEAVKDARCINIEVKEFSDKEEIAFELMYTALEKAGCLDSALISSFNLLLLERLNSRYPCLKTAYLYHPNIAEVFKKKNMAVPYPLFPVEEAVETAVAHRCRAIHPCIDTMTEQEVKQAHEAGLLVNAWTCNNVSQMNKAFALGCDGLITNYPDWAVYMKSKVG